jgi:hypothetical protein
VTSDKVLSSKRKPSGVNNLVDYQLTIQTRPGGALFSKSNKFSRVLWISNGVVNLLLFTCRFRCMLGYFFINQSGKFKFLIILRKDSPNFLRTILIGRFHVQPKTYLVSGILDISAFMHDRKQFPGCHGNYVNKSIICYFIIANKLKGRHILQ